jgi:hypothetical protein
VGQWSEPALADAGKSTSQRDSARKIAEGTGESPDAARMRINRGEQVVQKESQTIEFACEICGEKFDTEVWHCENCDHHWQLHLNNCSNCHHPRFKKPPIIENRKPQGGKFASLF